MNKEKMRKKNVRISVKVTSSYNLLSSNCNNFNKRKVIMVSKLTKKLCNSNSSSK